MFNRTLDIVISTYAEQLIDDKIARKAHAPETFEDVEVRSKCPFSKFAKYIPLPNIRHCSGIQSFFDKTILVNSWSDVWMNAKENDVEYQISNKLFTLSEHDRGQFNPLFPGMVAPKLMAPIHFTIPKGTITLASEAFYHYKANRTYANMRFPSGTIPNSYRPNIIGMMPIGEEALIKYNDPLMYFTILTDKKIKIHYELVTPQQFDNKTIELQKNKFVGSFKDSFNG